MWSGSLQGGTGKHRAEVRSAVSCIAAAADLYFRELEREKRWARIHLLPLLLAEQDRDTFRRDQAALAREKQIMSDVPGWEVSELRGVPRVLLVG